MTADKSETVATESRLCAAQQQLEADAEAAATEAAEIIRANLAQTQTLVRETIRVSAQADMIVNRANRGRAEGTAAILSAEHRARSADALPEQIVSQQTLMRPVFKETGHMLNEDTASKLRIGHNGRYVIAGQQVHGDIVMRAFNRVEFLPARGDVYTDHMATSFSLPAPVAGMPPIWPGNRFVGYAPEAVLEMLDQLVELETSSARRKSEVRFEPA